MSRQMKRAYLRLCPEKRRKKNLDHKGLNSNITLSKISFILQHHQGSVGESRYINQYEIFHILSIALSCGIVISSKESAFRERKKTK